ncbi:MAG: CAP domain-containing protein [Fibrobacteraceae bacterium]|nr:CAP domain-containing protein [Fibrobacteraceae bacterium]
MNSSNSTTSSSSSESLESWRDTCAVIVNDYRATENITPLVRNTVEESCTDNQAAQDLTANSAHGHFGSCNEYAQNTAPNIDVASYRSEASMIRNYLKMMWEEEKAKAEAGDTVYANIGHYLNLKNSTYSSIACGIAYNSDSTKSWININLYY